MFRTNLRGQIRQTFLPRWKSLLPLFEAVMNAVHATQELPGRDHRIEIRAERDVDLVSSDQGPFVAFTVTDTGIGFNDDNFDLFNEAYSEHKLGRGGKGLGRFIWLKAFDTVYVDSVFHAVDSDGFFLRSFVFDANYDPEHVELPQRRHGAVAGTTVKLAGFLEPYRADTSRDIDKIAERLIEHFILVLLNPACPQIDLIDGSTIVNLNTRFRDEFSANATEHRFSIADQEFTLHSFRLTAPRASKHKLIYCADDRAVVSENLDEYVPNLSGRLPADDGSSFVYLAVVRGVYLDARVNSGRTDFALAADDADAQPSLFEKEIRRSDIREHCLRYVRDDLAQVFDAIDADKMARIEKYVHDDAPQYRPLMRKADEFISRIPPGLSNADLEAALHRELHAREVALKREGGKIISEAAKLQDYGEYQERLSAFMDSYNDLGVAALAQYVAHRKIIIDFFEKAVSKKDDDNYPLEEVVHDIIFPMRSTNEEVLYSQQNLWLLDERLNYNSFVASDKPLKSLGSVIESELRKRPDLFIFDRRIAFAEGEQPLSSITVVEFKRPQRGDYTEADNPLTQVLNMVREIRAGTFLDENGRRISVQHSKIPAYCYVVCDIDDSLKRILEDRDADVTPDGQGFYDYNKTLGVYYEVIDYNKVLREARRRNRIFFEKLNVLM